MSFFLTILFLFNLHFSSGSEFKTDASKNILQNTPEGLVKLWRAYPDFIDSVNGNYLYWKDGTMMVYDDGIEYIDYEELLNNADLKEQMMQKYEKGSNWNNPPEKNFDPGRIRDEKFFKKMYGNSSSEVKNNLVTISWLPQTSNEKIQITSINGIDKQLAKISEELDKLPSDLKKYIVSPAGTFNWRVISGTKRLSMHSFGIAIDINTKYTNYWRWDKKYNYRNQIPMEIVEIFEKYGFIWGGKWYHYDTMHFEYRPELLID